MTFPTLLKKSLFVFGLTAASAAILRADDTYNVSLIQEAYASACHASPDPASMNYYLDQLESGARTVEDIKASIEKSCTASKTADPCQHVSGLSDLCKTANN